MLRERIEEPFLIEALRNVKVIRLASHCVQIAERLTHASVLSAKNALHVIVAKRASVAGGPSRHFLDNFERLLVAGVQIHVEQAGHNFVNRIEGRPDSFAIAKAVEKFNRKCAEVSTVVQTLLTFRQLSDDHIAVLLQIFIAGACVHYSDRREIMPTSIVTS